MAIGEKTTKKATAVGAAEATEEQISKEKNRSLEEVEEMERDSGRPYRSMKTDGAMDANAEEEQTVVEEEEEAEAVEQSPEEMRSQSDKIVAEEEEVEQSPEEMRSQSDKTYCAMDANGDDEYAVEEKEMKQSAELEYLKACTVQGTHLMSYEEKPRKIAIETNDGMCFPYKEYMSKESILLDEIVNTYVGPPATRFSDTLIIPLHAPGATFAIINDYWEKRTSFEDEIERMQWELTFASSLAKDRDAIFNVINLASFLFCQHLVTLLCEEIAHKAEKMTLEQMTEYFYPGGEIFDSVQN